MGTYITTKCIFTGLQTQPIKDNKDSLDYIVSVNNKNHKIRLPYYATQWQNDEVFFKENQNIFFALLYNDDWFEDENIYITIEALKALIDRKTFPHLPEEKLQNLFLKLLSYQKEDGAWIKFNSELLENTLWKIIYFKSFQELVFYMEILDSRHLIEADFKPIIGGKKLLSSYRITIEGLNYSIKLQEEGDKSNKCFVAMSFRNETIEIRNAIKQALEKTGFIPIIIDEKDIDSDKTINDEIIANLKRCKFCIADFTFQSNGVYFESGFAIGQGKKVIYTCRKDEFQKVHFDVRPLQHIIYETKDELNKKLINKIEAWIK